MPFDHFLSAGSVSVYSFLCLPAGLYYSFSWGRTREEKLGLILKDEI